VTRLTLIAVLFLAGCTSVADYRPYVQDVVDQIRLAADEKDCLVHAQAYSTPLALGSVGEALFKGAASNAAEGVINPLVPAAGGVGGASVALLNSLGVMSGDQRKVFLICLHDRGEHSQTYHVMDPNL
jgi:hypothetical protein